MTLSPHEFIRTFLMHVLPKGFHRIRHYGLIANGNRSAMIARARESDRGVARERAGRGADRQVGDRAGTDILLLSALR